MGAYQIIHGVVGFLMLISLSFICVCIARINTGWFEIDNTFQILTSPPTPPIKIHCEFGTLNFQCPPGGESRPLTDINPFFADGELWNRGGKVALSFCCIALPFLLAATIGSFVRGFKLSGNKIISTVTNLSCWLCALFLVFPWTVFLGMVLGHNNFDLTNKIKNISGDETINPIYCWAFSFIAWFFSLVCGLLMVWAMKSKGDGPFGSGGTASYAK